MGELIRVQFFILIRFSMFKGAGGHSLVIKGKIREKYLPEWWVDGTLK